jgi:hypothetical protein
MDTMPEGQGGMRSTGDIELISSLEGSRVSRGRSG